MNSYELSRAWFDYCFDNPEKIRPIHTAIFFFAIEHCNRLGWKQKFGFPSQMVMEAIGVKNWRTYSTALNEIIDFGFIKMVEISKNQYSSNIIAIVKNTKAPTKALDKALQKHSTKQGRSTVSIDKQYNKEQYNKDDVKENYVLLFEKVVKDFELSNKIKDLILTWLKYKSEKGETYKETGLKTFIKKIQREYKNEKFIEIAIEHSMSNNYSGIFMPKNIDQVDDRPKIIDPMKR